MYNKYINFIRGVSINGLGKIGVILTTSSFVTFLVLELARMVGILTSAYVGLITYLLLPVLFIIGLVFIPFAWRLHQKRSGMTTRELLSQRFSEEDLKGGIFGSRLLFSIGLLTIINVLFMIGASSRMLSFMDSARFCGTACHSVMNPEWVTYQQSPHARVKCVECHVGEGVGALIDSKLNGTWQMISVTFDLLERPIPTPVHQLRPARETCEKCHWPEKFYGNRLKTLSHYESDKASTRLFTTLNLKVDAGTDAATRGIHWHVAAKNQVRYASADDKRSEMIWVEARQPDGSFKKYVNRNLQKAEVSHDNIRSMDCVDCHNRATHIYENPSDAIDKRIDAGRIDRSLPYVKKEALKAIIAHYPSTEAAMKGIANSISGFYQRQYPDIAYSKLSGINKTTETLQAIYNRNIHHEMNITWGTYPSHIGHKNDLGCFRCHDDKMVDEQGNSIPSDCSLCHSILAYESEEAFLYLQPVDTTSKDSPMHTYLKKEFLNYSQ